MISTKSTPTFYKAPLSPFAGTAKMAAPVCFGRMEAVNLPANGMASSLWPEPTMAKRAEALNPALTQPVGKQTFVSPAGFPITLFTLSNGHRILVEQRPSNYIGVRTFVNTGSVVEDAVQPSALYGNVGLKSGITHLDEHLHLTSTQHYPQKNGMATAMNELGSHSNASTDDETIQHELFFNQEDLAQALRLHAESVLRPLLNTEEINQEKNNVWNENSFRLGEVPYKLTDKFNELMYERPGRQTIGTLEDLQAITPEDLRRFRQLAYAPDKLTTLVMGNVNPQQVFNVLAPEFLSNPVRSLPAANTALQMALKPNEIRVATVADPRISTGIAQLGFPAPPVTNYRDRMAMGLLTQILAGSSLSVLDKTLVDQSGLARHVGAYYSPSRQTGICKFLLDTPLGKEREAASALLNQIAQCPVSPVLDEHLDQARQSLIQKFRNRMRSTEEATQFMGEEASNNTLPYALHYEQIANLITVDDLREVARKYLNPNRYVLVYGLPGGSQAAVGGQTP